MNKTISKSEIRGIINAPTSKSALQRLIVAAFLSEGKSVIEFESMSEDALAVLDVARSLVKSVEVIDKKIEIIGGIQKLNEVVNVGESGLGLRMIAPVLAALSGTFEIAGKGSLLNRPVGFVVDTLQSCGVKVNDTNGSLPLIIKGPITSNRVHIDGSVGSQLLTGFLVAAPLLNKDFGIIVSNLKSRSYIDLTISILQNFEIEVSNDNYEKFTVKGGQSYKACSSYAEGDWSGAAFVLVAAAIAGELTLTGIDYSSLQGDKQIVDVLKQCGAEVSVGIDEIFVKKDKLIAFQFDATDVPDLFPPLVALAVNCKGKSRIKGVSRLKHKESDRAATLQSEFGKLGANIILEGDNMIIDGTALHGGNVFSNHDHRIAMALATAGLTINSKTIISGSDAVGKSWPGFFEQMVSLGAKIE